MRRTAAGGSTLAVSLSVDSGSPERAERRAAFQAAVAAVGEPARSVLEASGADALLEATGWRPLAGEPGESGERDAATRRRSAGFIVAAPA